MASDAFHGSVRQNSSRKIVNIGFQRTSEEVFQKLFDDGMALVEETAAYLDGHGREESKQLDRDAAMAYATQSMRLTTRLMQIASWLLVQRALRDGDMTLEEASDPQYELSRIEFDPGNNNVDEQLLPQRLTHLIHAGKQLFERIARLKQGAASLSEENASTISPVQAQQELLRNMFSR